MSQNKKSNLVDKEFKTVPRRRRGPAVSALPKKNPEPLQVIDCGDISGEAFFNKQTAIKRIREAIKEVQESDLFSSAFASLREAISLLEKPEVKEIYCLGLGHIGERMISRFQLALLLCLKAKFNAKIYIYDPIFHPVEKEILKEFGLIPLEENLEAKYTASREYATIFYLPHCPKQLTNNLLWANWGLNLKNCIIISNSFRNIVEVTPTVHLKENGFYILKVYNYVVELPVINTFQFYDIFNDTAIHIFPLKRLILIPLDFWNYKVEPEYQPESIEYISSKYSDTSII